MSRNDQIEFKNTYTNISVEIRDILLQFKHARHKLKQCNSYLNSEFDLILKIIGVQSQLAISFGADLVCNKIKGRGSINVDLDFRENKFFYNSQKNPSLSL